MGLLNKKQEVDTSLTMNITSLSGLVNNLGTQFVKLLNNEMSEEDLIEYREEMLSNVFATEVSEVEEDDEDLASSEEFESEDSEFDGDSDDNFDVDESVSEEEDIAKTEKSNKGIFGGLKNLLAKKPVEAQKEEEVEEEITEVPVDTVINSDSFDEDEEVDEEIEDSDLEEEDEESDSDEEIEDSEEEVEDETEDSESEFDDEDVSDVEGTESTEEDESEIEESNVEETEDEESKDEESEDEEFEFDDEDVSDVEESEEMDSEDEESDEDLEEDEDFEEDESDEDKDSDSEKSFEESEEETEEDKESQFSDEENEDFEDEIEEDESEFEDTNDTEEESDDTDDTEVDNTNVKTVANPKEALSSTIYNSAVEGATPEITSNVKVASKAWGKQSKTENSNISLTKGSNSVKSVNSEDNAIMNMNDLVNKRKSEAIESVMKTSTSPEMMEEASNLYNVTTESLLRYLKKIGVLGALNKLAEQENTESGVEVTDDVIEAASNLRKLTNKLEAVQALVVTRFDTQGIDITKYVNNEYTPEQMRIIGEALEKNYDVKLILNHEFSAVQMSTLLSLQNRGFDVSKIAKPEVNVNVMTAICKGYAMKLDMTAIEKYADRLSSTDVDYIEGIMFEVPEFDIARFLDEVFDVNSSISYHDAIYKAYDFLRNRHQGTSYSVTDNGETLLISVSENVSDIYNEVVDSINNRSVSTNDTVHVVEEPIIKKQENVFGVKKAVGTTSNVITDSNAESVENVNVEEVVNTEVEEENKDVKPIDTALPTIDVK